MKCPNCRKKLTVQHLKDSEACAKATASACGVYRLSKRVTPPKAGAGRPRKRDPRVTPMVGDVWSWEEDSAVVSDPAAPDGVLFRLPGSDTPIFFGSMQDFFAWAGTAKLLKRAEEKQ